MTAGVLMAGTALGVQTGWVQAADFRRGTDLNTAHLWAAGTIMAVGVVRAYPLTPVRTALGNTARMIWRIAAAVVAALSLVAGQEVVVVGARLGGQTESVYEHQLSAPMLTLVSGAALALMLLAMGMGMGMGMLLCCEVKRHRSRDAGAALSDDRPSRHEKRPRMNGF